MRLAIIGSRTFEDYERFLVGIHLWIDDIQKISRIVSGGAKGADSLGEQFADYYNIQKCIFKPDWVKHGKRAGFIRNQTIIDNCDMVLAFWDGKSKGTWDSIDKARIAKKPVAIIFV